MGLRLESLRLKLTNTMALTVAKSKICTIATAFATTLTIARINARGARVESSGLRPSGRGFTA